MKKMTVWATLLVAGMMPPLPVQAGTVTISSATITQINSDVNYGGCYAVLNKAGTGACTGTTVSFDCNGTYNTNGAGNRHYSTALLAFSLNKLVTLTLDDSRKYGTVCVATRVAIAK